MLKLMSDLISGKVVPEQLFPDSIFLMLTFSAVIHNLVRQHCGYADGVIVFLLLRLIYLRSVSTKKMLSQIKQKGANSAL